MSNPYHPTPPPQLNRRQMKINAICQAQLIKLLLRGELECKELAEETGLHYVTVLQYTRELHLAKAAYICERRADVRGRHTIKIYKLGEAKDVRKQNQTSAQRQRKHRAGKTLLAAQAAMTLHPEPEEVTT